VIRKAAPFVAGLIFALGLGVGGMTDPRKVLAFLDVLGAWDASLAFVMAGAIAVHLPFLRLAPRREVPGDCGVPTRPGVDAPLIAGSVVFGVGWGLSGYCPGPALVSSVTGGAQVIVFVMCMLLGVALYALLPSTAPLERPLSDV
jgi:uncharacterized membrane protein YedE/YeeE